MSSDRRPALVERARQLRQAFDLLWPVVLAIAGLVLIVAFVIVPELRQPALIASLSGLFTVVSTMGLASRGGGQDKAQDE